VPFLGNTATYEGKERDTPAPQPGRSAAPAPFRGGRWNSCSRHPSSKLCVDGRRFRVISRRRSKKKQSRVSQVTPRQRTAGQGGGDEKDGQHGTCWTVWTKAWAHRSRNCRMQWRETEESLFKLKKAFKRHRPKKTLPRAKCRWLPITDVTASAQLEMSGRAVS